MKWKVVKLFLCSFYEFSLEIFSPYPFQHDYINVWEQRKHVLLYFDDDFQIAFHWIRWANRSLRSIPSPTKKCVRHLQNRPGSIASDYLESIRLQGTFSLSFQCLSKSSEKCLGKPAGSVSKPQISGTMLVLVLEREKKKVRQQIEKQKYAMEFTIPYSC